MVNPYITNGWNWGMPRILIGYRLWFESGTQKIVFGRFYDLTIA
jgi:hypothetical protein